MKNIRKYFYWNKARSYLSLEIGYLPMCQLGIDFGEDLTFSIGFLIQFYISISTPKLKHWLYKIEGREIRINMWFRKDWTVSLNLMSDETGWKKGGWKRYWDITGMLKGKSKVSKHILEEKDILIPMPEKNYQGHAILVDWTWIYPRWFSETVRRCEIEIPEGLPFPGKGENSWDCGDDAISSIITGEVKSIAKAVGNLVGDVLGDRVRYGGWKDWNWELTKEIKK